MGPESNMTGVYTRRGRCRVKAQRQRDAQERGLRDKRGRDWSEATADLGAPRIVAPPPEGSERQGTTLPLRTS